MQQIGGMSPEHLPLAQVGETGWFPTVEVQLPVCRGIPFMVSGAILRGRDRHFVILRLSNERDGGHVTILKQNRHGRIRQADVRRRRRDQMPR